MLSLRLISIFGILVAGLTVVLVDCVHGNAPNASTNEKCDALRHQDRIECLTLNTGNGNVTEEEACAARKCCWDPTPSNDITCFYPQSYLNYRITYQKIKRTRIEAILQRNIESGFEGDVGTLRIEVDFLTSKILRVKIVDPKKIRFEPPVPKMKEYDNQNLHSLNYELKITPHPSSFQIIRKSTNETLFNTSIGALVVADQYLELSTRLSTSYLYGIGEHADSLLRGAKSQTFTLFSRGELVRSGEPGFNLYGVHPFYLNVEKSGKANAVLLRNSNAMDIIAYESSQLTYRVIGGIFDFYYFIGDSPAEAISLYTETVGHPFMPPYWTLGFHLCRYQYNSDVETRKVWQRNRDAGIPFDAQWSDIDYMDDRKCFTYDKVNYAGLPQLVDDIHNAGMHYMMITDPGLSLFEIPGSYVSIDEAKALDILIRDANGDYLTGLVWQNYTAFVDFSHPKAADYWMRQFKILHDQIPFDGSWIDMNEPYSFVSGSHKGCPDGNKYDYPPYVPGKDKLYNGTICMSAKQHIGEHYFAHNIYGFQEGIATNMAMKKIIGKRPFVLSRSTFSGFGHYGGHWLGDVRSDWSFLKESVDRMISFNIYGIPMVGSDICGFVGNTTFELCQRWTQLGAFYPFARNHNDFDTVQQDPAFMGPEMVALFKDVFKIRYYLLPYLYTLFYYSNLKGDLVIKPLFFEFPTDLNALKSHGTFLWGSALLVIPVLEEGRTNVTTYIPQAVWYDYYTGEMIENTGNDTTFDAPLTKINLLLRGGHVIPAQEPAVTTTLSRKNNFHLIIVLDENGTAQGNLYWDDGESINPKYNTIQFNVSKNTLDIAPTHTFYDTEMTLSKLVVYGLKNQITKVVSNNNKSDFDHSETNQILEVDIIGVSLLVSSTIQWFE